MFENAQFNKKSFLVTMYCVLFMLVTFFAQLFGGGFDGKWYQAADNLLKIPLTIAPIIGIFYLLRRNNFSPNLREQITLVLSIFCGMILRIVFIDAGFGTQVEVFVLVCLLVAVVEFLTDQYFSLVWTPLFSAPMMCGYLYLFLQKNYIAITLGVALLGVFFWCAGYCLGVGIHLAIKWSKTIRYKSPG